MAQFTNLKSLRLRAGLSQNRLARLSDLDRTTISAAERGQVISELTAEKLIQSLKKFADATEKDIAEIYRPSARKIDPNKPWPR